MQVAWACSLVGRGARVDRERGARTATARDVTRVGGAREGGGSARLAWVKHGRAAAALGSRGGIRSYHTGSLGDAMEGSEMGDAEQFFLSTNMVVRRQNIQSGPLIRLMLYRQFDMFNLGSRSDGPNYSVYILLCGFRKI
jgi:hypothetical protein